MASRREPIRVLLVEDEPANRALVRAILARAEPDGYRLREAETLADARAAVKAEEPDVVLLDVRLPDGNGLELACELSASGAAPRPAIIVMSASVLPAERADALAAGVDRFISKPYEASELLGALARSRARS
jgi:CheY-like chemotaxis protein